MENENKRGAKKKKEGIRKKIHTILQYGVLSITDCGIF